MKRRPQKRYKGHTMTDAQLLRSARLEHGKAVKKNLRLSEAATARAEDCS